MSAQLIYQVDSFTGKPFSGNPAGVCILPGPAEEHWMQDVAAEMNLSETAFLYPTGESYNLRWFTPAVEVALCGHATLASAHILWQEGYLAPEQDAQFDTRSGRLTAKKIPGERIEMDFPADPPKPATVPAGLLDALGLDEAQYVGQGKFDYLIELKDAESVRNLSPNFGKLARIESRGIIVTSSADSAELDFISRFFAPAAGIDEDPVTGSAHCCLAPFWADRLGKNDLRAYQASKRGGRVDLTVAGKRILIAGQAVTVFKAAMY